MQGQVINGFVLKKLLGRGGMAKVWHSESKSGQKEIISKVMAFAAALVVFLGPHNLNGAVEGDTDIPSGVFSVSPTEKVRFAQGNIQYQKCTETWHFAEHQYDYAGKNGKPDTEASYYGWIDYCQWGPGSHPAGIYEYYIEDDAEIESFWDWGNNNIINGDSLKWRTLSIEEWKYILNKRKTVSGIRYVKAQVNGICGLILLPDNWSELTFPLKNPNKSDVDFCNIITIEQWDDMEKSGAVFLPAAGRVWLDVVENVGSQGCYWSSTPHKNIGSGSACYVYFDENCIDFKTCHFEDGMSVRLVSPVK